MSEAISTLEGHISSIIETRRATRDSRFKPLPAGVERVPDVAQEALAWLHDRLAADGFKSAPSQLRLSRRFGEITQRIGLQAMSGNLSGSSVEVVLHAGVKSASRKRWTETEGTRYGSEFLWVKQIGYLGGEHNYHKWQLVDPASREQALTDMLQKIRTLALPALDAWASKDAIAEAVFRGTELDREDWLVETALWAGHREAAQRLLPELLARNPRLVPEYQGDLLRYQAAPTVRQPFRPSPASALALAFLAARYDLTDG